MAQDPPKSTKPKIVLKRTMFVATLNVQGMYRVMKREEVERWMKEHGVEIMAIQETHDPHSKVGTRKHFPWYFSGSDDGERGIHAGVEVVIRNELLYTGHRMR